VTTLDEVLIQAIDQRVAAGEKMLLAMGTVASWDANSPTDVMVTFDSASVAVPCKVFDLWVAEGDRVGLAKFDRWWTVVGTFTKTWRELLGGTQWSSGGNLVIGLTTELVTMVSESIFLPAMTHIRVSAGIRLLASATDTYVFRIRDGSTTGGTERAQFTWTAQSNAFGYNQFFWGQFDSGSTPVVQTFCVSGARVSGGGSLNMIAGGVEHNTHINAYAEGPAGMIQNNPA
jgi:hypothetical protein